MAQIPLGDTGRTTTRLGFGCSSLMGAMGRRASLAILESAYDAGIRHFDVAPMYGYGEAEGCLGEFLQRHRHQITVTTKYGIPPQKNRP
ncbi:aldo/keto reductase [Tunturiibacter gelidiferens]|uniref:aldo/keto reductase n=1 Tax=Tunturiibacter gelidiferens TaxID=3069689 RepID=UPI003D9B5B6E